MHNVKLDKDGRLSTPLIREEADGGLTIHTPEDHYELAPEYIADGPAFARTLLFMRAKNWWNELLESDLAIIVAHQWLRRA